MKRLCIIGAGTAGTIMANKLARKLEPKEWSISIIDKYKTHYYQPGFLFIPFGTCSEKDVTKKKSQFLPKGVHFIQQGIQEVDGEHNCVILDDGHKESYDILIIATGSVIVPDEVDGLLGDGWHRDVFDFYTIEGATALRDKFRTWKGGKLVVHLAEMPIKCPVAPLEFAFLADSFFTKTGIREKVEIAYVTPLSGAFTKANCSRVLGHLLENKGIKLIPDFDIETVNEDQKYIQSYGNNKVDYDLLVTVPTNMGDELIERSELGDELRFISTHPNTLQSRKFDNMFILGDATDLPSSKAGSVAHFQADVLTENILRYIKGMDLKPDFDGHANCFIESGHGKAFLIDFNYDVEPVEGQFPIPGIGPFSLLKETRINHLGKLAFRWIYWNLLLKGRPMPGISTQMSLRGKKIIQQRREEHA